MSYAILPEIIIEKQRAEIERLESALARCDEFISYILNSNTSLIRALTAIVKYAAIVEDGALVAMVRELTKEIGEIENGK